MSKWTADVVIVGGGPAGLSAALVLARAGRDVVVVDSGSGRNAPASHAHNVFTRDGTPPSELRRIGREQAEAYGARFITSNVTDATAVADGVELHLEDGRRIRAPRAVLATGVVDDLPAIPGIAQAWGKSVVNCPYCHGHEFRGQPTVVLAKGTAGFEFSRLLTGWTDRITMVSEGPAELTAEQREMLAERGIAVREEKVRSVEVEGESVRALVLDSGERLPCGVVYLRPPHEVRGPLADRLGLRRTDADLIWTDDTGRTSLTSVYACGDIVTPKHMVQIAAASGAQVGAALNHELIVEGLIGIKARSLA